MRYFDDISSDISLLLSPIPSIQMPDQQPDQLFLTTMASYPINQPASCEEGLKGHVSDMRWRPRRRCLRHWWPDLGAKRSSVGLCWTWEIQGLPGVPGQGMARGMADYNLAKPKHNIETQLVIMTHGGKGFL